MIREPQSFDAFLQRLRQFVRTELVPHEPELARRKGIPGALVTAMAREGLFGLSIPRDYGGAGLTTEELVLAAIELSQCAVAFRMRIGTNTGIGSEAIVVDGTPAQRERFLPGMARGEITGAMALTEPEAGSDAASLKTLAVRDGNHYVLNGRKCFASNAPIADVITVLARTDPESRGARGVSAFLVERGTPGMKVGEPYEMMGQEGVPISDVTFEDCRVPVANLLGGEEGTGFRTTMKVLNKQRLHLAGLCIGPAIRMLEEAVKFTSQRRQFGQPVSSFQLVQAMIADCQTEIHAARALVLESARKRDVGDDIAMEASMCKYFASEMCGRVADRCVQMLGGYGYRADFPLERFYRDVRPFRIYEGTSQIHQLTIARQTLARAAIHH